MVEQQQRLKGLDGLRGIAAVGVMIFHLRIIYAVTGNPFAGIPGTAWVQHHGLLLVDLFFVISGYVFHHVYLGEGASKDANLKRFTIDRFSRLWPLHFANLCVMAVLMRDYPQSTPGNFMLSALFLQGLSDEQIYNSVAWSVSVECLCYAVFALSLQGGRRMVMAAAPIGILVGAFCIESGWSLQVGRGLIGFFAGVLLYVVHRLRDGIPTAFLAVCAATPFLKPAEGGALDYIRMDAIGWCAIVLLTIRLRAFSASVAHWLGDRSYAIYLCHLPVFYTAASVCKRQGFEGDIAAFTASAVTLALVVWLSAVARRTIERPWLKRIRQSLPVEAAATSNTSLHALDGQGSVHLGGRPSPRLTREHVNPAERSILRFEPVTDPFKPNVRTVGNRSDH